MSVTFVHNQLMQHPVIVYFLSNADLQGEKIITKRIGGVGRSFSLGLQPKLLKLARG